jgi:hypothetical protein
MQILRTWGACGAMALVLCAPLGAQGPGGILPTPQDSPNRQGTRGANFLHIGVGARAGGMGGAVASTVAGPVAWFWNPAGAAVSERFNAVAGRQELYGNLGVGQTYAAASIPLLGGVVGFNLNTLNSGEIKRTTTANPFGERLGGNTFQWTSTVVGAGYARRLTDRLSVGGQFKYINEGIPDASTSWMAGDIGTQFNTGLYGIVVGGAIQNVGGSSRASGALLSRLVNSNDGSVFRENRRVDLFTRATEIPIIFRVSIGSDLIGSANSLFGGAGGPHQLTAELAVNDGTDFSTQAAVGIEYGYKGVLYARGGQRLYNDDRNRGGYGGVGLAGGFGLKFPLLGRPVRFDYSYEGAGALQNIQIFSFEVGR